MNYIRNILLSGLISLSLSACGAGSQLDEKNDEFQNLDRFRQHATDIGNPSIQKTSLITENVDPNRDGSLNLNRFSALGCVSEIDGEIDAFEFQLDLVVTGEDSNGESIVHYFMLESGQTLKVRDFAVVFDTSKNVDAHCEARLLDQSGQLVTAQSSPATHVRPGTAIEHDDDVEIEPDLERRD